MVLRKWLSSLTNRPRTDRARRRAPNQAQREVQAAPQLIAEALETRQVLSAVIAGIETDHGVDASDEITNSGTFDLHGTAAGDSVLQITRNGSFVGAILVNSDGAWRFAQTNLAEGNYEFSANDGEGSSSLSVRIDKTAPTATLSTSVSGPTNAATLPISLNFSEAVDGLSLEDLVIGNGTASNLSGSGTSYTFDVTPTSDGEVTIGLNASTVIDLAGNANGMTASLSIDSDRTAPAAPSVSDPSGSSLTNSSSATIAGSADAGSLVRLYRDADGSGTLSEGDTQVVQQQLGEGESSFSFSAGLTADADNRFVVTASDSATNESTASAVPTITQDSTNPTASISFGVTGPTNAASIPVTVNFSEDVSGFDASDVSVGNGTLSDFVSVSATQATFNVAPSADGNVTIDIAGGAASDAAGNSSNAATQASIGSDTTKPTVSFTPVLSAATNVSPLRVTVQFSEDVAGLDLSDLSITNGSASDLTGSGSLYSFDLTPAADGEVVVSLAGDAVADAASNTNNSAEYHVQSDRTAPGTPSVSSPAATTLTNAASISITGSLAAAEDTLVRVYRESDGSVAGEQLLLGGLTEFSISVTLTANSSDRFLVTASDSVGNESASVATAVVTQDSHAPVTTVAISGSNPSNATTLSASVSFDEDVIGFTADDVTVFNATLSNFVAVDGSHFTFDLTPTEDGTVTVHVAAEAASDGAGNTSGAASTSIESDRSAPLMSLTAPEGPTNSATLDFTVMFSETVMGLTTDDFSVTNGSIESLTGSGAEYHLIVTPTSDGLVSVSLADGAASDAAGNTSSGASAQAHSDRTAPTVSILSESNELTNAESIEVTITFNEAVDGFSAEDLSIVNGSASDFGGSGSSYWFTLTPTSDGTVTVDVAADAAQDAATNGNSTATQFSIVSDRTAPSFSFISLTGTQEEGSPISAELGVSDASAITELSWAAGGGPIFTNSVEYAEGNTGASINFTPLDNGMYQATLTATDAAGNSSTADVIVEINNVAPTANDDMVSLAGSAGDDWVSLVYEDDVLEGEGLLDNDTDPAGENDPLAVVDYDTISEHGVPVTVYSDGSFTYDPTTSEEAQSLGADEIGYDTFSYTIADGDGGESSGTVTVEIHGVNDAPVLNDTAAVRLDAIDANDVYNHGVDIETFAFDRIDEIDANDLIGIAVIGFSRATTRGDWEFSTDGGESWTTIDGVSEHNALHLVADGQTRLRLRPDGSHTGTARLTVRAWDGSNGVTREAYSDITGTGDTAAYSSDTITLRQTVLSAGRDATIAVSDTFETSTDGDFGRFAAFYEGDESFDGESYDDEFNEDESEEFFETDEYDDSPEYRTLGGEPQFASVSGNVLDNDIDPDTALPDGVSVQFATNLDLSLLGQSFGAPGDVPALAITQFGVLHYESDGSFDYIAEPGFFASLGEGETAVDGFLYFVTDGRLTSNVAAVSILVTGVNDAPFVTMPLSDAVAVEGQRFCLGLPGGLFEDVDTGDSLTVTATKTDGCPLPEWLSFDGDQLKFRGTPSEDDLGTISLRLTATDEHGYSTSLDFQLEVVDVNHAPTAGTLEDVSVNEGDTLTLTLPADLFHDSDAGDELIVGINDANGYQLPGFFAFDENTGTLTVTPGWSDAGEYEVFVTAMDSAGDIVSTGFTVSVLNTRLNIHVTGHADDPNEAWSLFADGDGLLHITRNGVDEIAPVSLDEVQSVTLDTGDGNDTVTLAASLNDVDENDGGSDGGSDGGEDDGGLFINLGAGNDSVDATALSFSVQVFGGDGNDLMLGGTDSDFFSGEAGNDTLIGAGGDDLLLGGDGNDTLRGGAGNDSLDGGADNDLVVGQGGGDLLLGGTGNDTVDGGVGNDSMLGNDGNDSMTGGTGHDIVIGGAGNDTLLGNEGTDTLIGGSGIDSLSGGTSHDVGVGGEGDVSVRGGAGQSDTGDVLRGDVETANETFDIKYEWEFSTFGLV